jgi:hypothetical protein
MESQDVAVNEGYSAENAGRDENKFIVEKGVEKILKLFALINTLVVYCKNSPTIITLKVLLILVLYDEDVYQISGFAKTVICFVS